ncbi:ABC-type phosphate/phosphonate transport system, periplasmic component [Pleurocapsa sp. PCC 7327]|uniref:phosphate/phosphite/phosphonate ABC transporter substrate-binding protein n=1 Tax=Pleurocapsa sp. PCC 7327 TaxID=118163 RepID=UPI00029F8AB6|nr:PhnD/SsuA/transferrin family substrate-binding protein [Pleurocapsa sp. PCC 7327]AFY78671.1 ABC-type phosphate/phosphonate transport system, periplasmic component [Pleurocapsa sp. PCC 7327]
MFFQSLANVIDDLAYQQSISRRLFLVQMLLLTACGAKTTQTQIEELVIGVISYEQGKQILNRFDRFNRYLGEKMRARIEIEPAFNETLALDRIEARDWSLVFAPPGVAASAIAYHQYTPLFPLQDDRNLRSIFVVRQDNPVRDLKALNGQTIVLGKQGSATGYYFPLYNLYGLTLAEIMFAPTPKTVLEWVAQGKATAGAISEQEFNLYSSQLDSVQLRVLFTDPRNVPSGSVLIAPTIERNREGYIRQVMSDAPTALAQEVGYLADRSLPDYQYMISVVKRVRAIATHVREKPARLIASEPS